MYRMSLAFVAFLSVARSIATEQAGKQSRLAIPSLLFLVHRHGFSCSMAAKEFYRKFHRKAGGMH